MVHSARQDTEYVVHVVQHRLLGKEAFTVGQELADRPLSGVRSLTLSLAWVKEIDASGVSALVRVLSQLQNEKIRVVLADVCADVHAVLARLGLTRVVRVTQRPVVVSTSTAPAGLPSDSRA